MKTSIGINAMAGFLNLGIAIHTSSPVAWFCSGLNFGAVVMCAAVEVRRWM